MSIDTSVPTPGAPTPTTPIQRDVWHREIERTQFADWFHAYEAAGDTATTAQRPRAAKAPPTGAVTVAQHVPFKVAPISTSTPISGAAHGTQRSAAIPSEEHQATAAEPVSGTDCEPLSPKPNATSGIQALNAALPSSGLSAFQPLRIGDMGTPRLLQVGVSSTAPAMAVDPTITDTAPATSPIPTGVLQTVSAAMEMASESEEAAELTAPMARFQPPTTQTPLPFRVHTETSAEGTTAWIALPAHQVFGVEQLAKLPALIAELDHALQAQGQMLWQVVCNGQVVWRRTSISHTATTAAPMAAVFQSAAEVPETDSGAEPSSWVQTPRGPLLFNQLFKET